MCELLFRVLNCEISFLSFWLFFFSLASLLSLRAPVQKKRTGICRKKNSNEKNSSPEIHIRRVLIACVGLILKVERKMHFFCGKCLAKFFHLSVCRYDNVKDIKGRCSCSHHSQSDLIVMHPTNEPSLAPTFKWHIHRFVQTIRFLRWNFHFSAKKLLPFQVNKSPSILKKAIWHQI